jgi:V/A-type H+-transporting ATPase subunit C
MSVSTYAYVNARIGGMKSFLLKEEDFKALIESRNIEDLFSQLKNTHYGPGLSDADVLSLELQLKRSLFQDYLKLINCVEGKPKEFVHNMAKRFEVDTLKSIVKMKFLNISLPEYLIPFGKIDEALIDRLLKAEGIAGLLEELKGTEYYGHLKGVHQLKPEEPEEDKALEGRDLPYLNILDAYYFAGVINSMEGLSKKDKSVVKRFVGFNIDISNLLMALRLRGIEGITEEYFIEGGESFTLKHFTLTQNLENLARLPEIVPRRFVDVTLEGGEKYNENKSLLSFDLATKKRLLKESRKLFLGDRFHIGTIIAYLYLKENEISNLIKIIKTKDEFFSANDIEDLLVLV